MPAPLAPIAITALRVGTIAATAWYFGRKSKRAPKHVWRETALNETADGVEVTTDRSAAEQNAHASLRYRRAIRLPNGRGIEIDFASISRIRFRHL